jgi:hypothetical protein
LQKMEKEVQNANEPFTNRTQSASILAIIVRRAKHG